MHMSDYERHSYETDYYLLDSLLAAAEAAEKPDKENPANRPFRFPKYIDGTVKVDWSWARQIHRVEYLEAPASAASSTRGYQMSCADILHDPRTACMIKNIPNRYTAEMLIHFINDTHFGQYDFFYLRMDFKNRCNVGYAFINFVSCEAVLRFYKRINGHRWACFSSSKVAELTYASIQGIDNLKRKFKRSLVMLEDRSFRPKMFYTEGPNRGYEKPQFE
ncbi:hypothetical protein PAPHI01_0761 [Pancytospora philotis]|nr:hypothetical protein PAPHI01_0761 [Pancytospora philotis]